MSDTPTPDEDRPISAGETPTQRLVDRLRDTGVGVEDPNIVGDVGPVDVAPGADPETAEGDGLLVETEPGEDPGQV